MCGISGIVVAPGAHLEPDVLARMNHTLWRRGPDDEGYFFDHDGGCGLGHRRLSIIDLSGGHQPLGSAGGLVQVVVNGEIYNFKPLRTELEARGFVFRTKSDSEVVAHGWVAWGTELFARIDGMFALAIWDGRTRHLVLARDRMGKKPMYYAFLGPKKDTLIFGSEMKALLAHPDLERRVSPAGLSAYLAYECLPEDDTIYAGVSRLLPATVLIYERDRQRARTFEYWRMRFGDSPLAPVLARETEAQLAERLRCLIRDATRARLVSDVPLGVLLSGGIDSSTVAAAMAEVVPSTSIKTFSITFEDESYDESTHARKVARHLGTDHREQRLSPQVMIDILPEISDFMCEPLGDASIIPTYLLARFARESVTVALGGDGGDELFLGYPTFQADVVARLVDGVLSPRAQARMGRAISRVTSLFPVSSKNFSLDFKLKKFVQGLGFTPDHRHQAWMGSFVPDDLHEVFAENFRMAALARDPFAVVASFRERSTRDHLDAAVMQYARLYLAADVLVKVDRASMARGLEVRAPLLDTRIVEFATALPGKFRLHGLTTKYLLKKAAAPWLPREIIERPKKGFGVPIAEWLRGPLRQWARDLLAPEKLRREGFFNPEYVTRLLVEHDDGKANHRKPLWTLLAFELWLERYGPTSARPA